MTVTISSEDPRSIKAIEIAAGARHWLKCRSVDGELGFAIPSQCKTEQGRHYLVTAHQCDCQDFQRNGLSTPRIGEQGYHGPCKHILAVRLHLELARAQQIQPRRSSSAFDRYDRPNGEIVYLPHRTRIHDTQRED